MLLDGGYIRWEFDYVVLVIKGGYFDRLGFYLNNMRVILIDLFIIISFVSEVVRVMNMLEYMLWLYIIWRFLCFEFEVYIRGW